jgi:uncharacterized protein (TIGR03083 family)
MHHAQHCDALADEAMRLAELVADPAAPAEAVPTCPGWAVADIVEHVGTLYHWSSAHVATNARARLDPRSLDLGRPAEGATPEWLANAIEPMMSIFRTCDPEAGVWGWGADRHARFWPRRMLFETVVHRADASFALGVDPEIDAEVAADGIDELLSNLPHAAYFAPNIAELRGDDERVSIRAVDPDISWSIRLLPAGYAWDWSDRSADVTVSGRASDLLLLLYRRRPADDAVRFERAGDLALLDRILANTQL